MSDIIISEGLVLSKKESGDFDNYYTIFTNDYGRLGLLAKSSRKPKAKLSPHLEPGSIVKISFVSRKNKSDYLLTGALLIWKPCFLKLTSIQNKLIIQGLSCLKELISEDSQELESLVYLYKLSLSYLKKIAVPAFPHASPEGKNQNILFLYQSAFLLKLLNQAGFSPNLKHCALSDKKIKPNDKLYYDNHCGGIVCFEGIRTQKMQDLAQNRLLPVGFDSLKLINYLTKKNLSEVAKLRIEAPLIKITWRLVLNHLKYCLE